VSIPTTTIIRLAEVPGSLRGVKAARAIAESRVVPERHHTGIGRILNCASEKKYECTARATEFRIVAFFAFEKSCLPPSFVLPRESEKRAHETHGARMPASGVGKLLR